MHFPIQAAFVLMSLSLLAMGNGYSADTPARDQPDEAAQQLLERLAADPVNRRYAEAWQAELENPSRAVIPPDLTVIFVPGFGYKSLSGNGADLSGPRRAIEAMGFKTELAPLHDTAPVETNADILADHIRRHPARRLWLVSASAGGPTTAEALSRLAAAKAEHRVEVWLNIGGLLRGTALADAVLGWPKNWLIRALFTVKGWDFATVRSLSTEPSRARAAGWKWASSIRVVNLVGIPRAVGEVSREAVDGYRQLAALGPNDGLTLIEDALADGAPTLLLPGYDHFLLAPDIDQRTQAIARLLLGANPNNRF
jgi:hypothetical protein